MPIAYGNGQLSIDLDLSRVNRDGNAISLTKREWAMLLTLVNSAGRVVTPRQLLQDVWGPDYGNEGDYVRAYIARLRKKLEPDPHKPRYILLERGCGYRMVTPDEDAASVAPLAFLQAEASRDISLNLRALLRAQEEWLEVAVQRQRQLLMWADSIDRSLSDVVNAGDETPLRSSRQPGSSMASPGSAFP